MNQPLANIHPNAKIAENVTIEPFVTIRDNVEIGEGSWIGTGAVICEGARLGKNVRIFPGAQISAIPQDLKFDGEETLTVIGDNTVVREFATVSRGTVDKFRTEIGSNCLIMAYVHVAHDCIIGNNCIIVNGVQLGGHVVIGDFAIIGGTSAVHQFVKIGAHAMISGGALVRKDVPPYCKAAREPISYAGINAIGLKRRGFPEEKINEIQEIYRIVYLNGNNNSDALEQIETNFPQSAERDLIVNFIKAAKRGIMRGADLKSRKDNSEE